MKIVFLGIGTNLGDREGNLKEAMMQIEKNVGTILKSSSVYETEPWGFLSDNKFLNSVLKVESNLTPSGLLGAILMIEVLLGRVRSENQYSSRVIDIDVLLYGDQIIDEASFKVPHPRLHERKFVLIPLCEIEPGLIHPVLNKSISDLLSSCKDSGEVRKFC